MLSLVFSSDGKSSSVEVPQSTIFGGMLKHFDDHIDLSESGRTPDAVRGISSGLNVFGGPLNLFVADKNVPEELNGDDEPIIPIGLTVSANTV